MVLEPRTRILRILQILQAETDAEHPITSAADLGTVPSELIGCFNLIFYNSAEDAIFKALGVE